MAVKKNTNVDEAVETIAEEITEEVEETPKTVPHRLPRKLGQNAVQQEFFSVNFKNYLIETGKEVQIPIEVYNLIKDNERAVGDAQDYIDANPLRDPSNK